MPSQICSINKIDIFYLAFKLSIIFKRCIFLDVLNVFIIGRMSHTDKIVFVIKAYFLMAFIFLCLYHRTNLR